MYPSERCVDQHLGRLWRAWNRWPCLRQGLGVLAVISRRGLIAGVGASGLWMPPAKAFWQSRDSNYNKAISGGGGGGTNNLAVDGTPATTNWNSSATGTISVTTTGSLGVLLIAVSIEQATPQTVSSVTASGLSFTKRAAVAASVDDAASADADLELWWAPYSSKLTALIVTVTTSAAIDDGCIVAFPISGCNTSSPFDPTSAATGDQTSSASGVATITQTTTNANDILICIGCQVDNNSPIIGNFGAAPATAIFTNGTSGGVNFMNIGLQFLIVSATQASIADTMTFAFHNVGTLMIADAVVSS
jgi:hypothetical protein